MATQKPISTISYNTESFLKEKLDTWVSQHIIQSYMYICHKGEEGDKDHIHVRIEPNKKLDPMDLQEELKEYKLGEKKPLGVRPFRPSKEEDWIMYSIHDKQYLKVKYGGAEAREKLPYSWEDIKAPEDYDVEIAFIRAKAKLERTPSNIAARIQKGVDPKTLISEGYNVYELGAVLRLQQQTDYENQIKKNLELAKRFGKLIDAIQNEGYYVEIKDNGEEEEVILHKLNEENA